MSDHEDPPELLTTGDVARIFKVARSTVAGWADKGLLPHIRTPTGRLRFHRRDIDRMLAGEPPPAEPPAADADR